MNSTVPAFLYPAARAMPEAVSQMVLRRSAESAGDGVSSMIFWKRPEADLQAGQLLLAKLMMQKDVQEKYSQTTGSIPVRTDVDLSGPAWSDGQRDAAAALIEAFKSKRVLLSLAHNMAQPNQISAAMIDVITEFIHNDKVNPEQAVARLAQAVDNARG